MVGIVLEIHTQVKVQLPPVLIVFRVCRPVDKASETVVFFSCWNKKCGQGLLLEAVWDLLRRHRDAQCFPGS